jgi:AcrR family transcriptional regulator
MRHDNPLQRRAPSKAPDEDRGEQMRTSTARDGQTRVRTRDPERRSRILAAAADLVARKGFHAVSVAEIGASAGITGSGIYRHFDRKTAVLVALCDQIIDDLLRDEQEILDSGTDLSAALDQLIAGQVEFVVDLAAMMAAKAGWLYDQAIQRAKHPMSPSMPPPKPRSALSTSTTLSKSIGAMAFPPNTDWTATGSGPAPRIAPVSREMIINYVAQHSLSPPRSY